MPDLETSLELCTYCPRLCSHTCPTSLTSGREALTPQSKMARFAGLRLELQKEQRLGAAAIAAEPAGGQAALRSLPLWACTGCGACTDACLHEVEPASALMVGRADAQGTEAGHPALYDLPERHRRRAQAAADCLGREPELAGRVAAAQEVAFLPACLPRGPKEDGPAREAQVALRVCDRLRKVHGSFPAVGLAALSAAGSGVGPGPGGCAGYPLYAGGFAESFRLHAEAFARSLENYATLALSCSACTWLLRTQYRAHGVPLRPRVLHISELLAPHAAALPITRPLARASYQDPCHLGRRLGCYEPPRQLLRRAVKKLFEMPGQAHGHEDPSRARCCGSGGLLPKTDPSLARAIAAERLSDADPQHGPLVTACPACQHHLAKSGGGSVLGLLDILDEATSEF